MDRQDRIKYYRQTLNSRTLSRTPTVRAKALQSGNPLENLFYELKPLIYLGLMTHILLSHNDLSVLTKASSMGVAGFAVFIMYSRLTYRGHL